MAGEFHMKRIFIPDTFIKSDLLTLGLVGNKQINIADSYSNTGSMYLTPPALLPLGLPANQEFWSGPLLQNEQSTKHEWQVFPKGLCGVLLEERS